MKIDLNADIGEGYPNDADLIPFISSANIACGAHAGNWDTLLFTIEVCLKYGVAIGAHPSFPDKANFGRKNMILAPDDLKMIIQNQLEFAQKACKQLGTKLHHVKPHGALYNKCASSRESAQLLAETIYTFEPSLKLYGLSNSYSISEGVIAGLQTVAEVFADRSYEEDGSLTPRNMPNSVHEDEQTILDQAVLLATAHQVLAKSGKTIPLMVESICLHGDTPHALSSARLIHQKFTELGISIQSIF